MTLEVAEDYVEIVEKAPVQNTIHAIEYTGMVLW